jgi:ribosomal protein S18 acetylase RimI-like enzyme
MADAWVEEDNASRSHNGWIMAIRKATERDYPEILKIMNGAANSHELKGFVPPPEITKKFLNNLKSQLELKEQGVLIADLNMEPVGFVFFIQESDCLEIEEIDVLADYQKRGVGKALVNNVERIAKDRKLALLKTGTSVNNKGIPWRAYGFWLRMGLEDTGERTDSGYGFSYCKFIKRL